MAPLTRSSFSCWNDRFGRQGYQKLGQLQKEEKHVVQLLEFRLNYSPRCPLQPLAMARGRDGAQPNTASFHLIHPPSPHMAKGLGG